MASTDWAYLTNGLAAQDCARGVTSGTTKPNGGGTFAFAFNTITNTPGAAGLYAVQNNFGPLAKGGVISGAMVRALSGGLVGFSAFIFIGATGNDVSDVAYMLGLSDGSPSHIELRKGIISAGLPDEAPGGVSKILRRSTDTIAIDAWTHLKLEQVVNDNGDVILNVYRSNLVARAVDAPVWEAIPGMASFTDDALGINSGSAPLTSGYVGFGVQVSDIARRTAFDQIAIARQL